MSEGLTEQERQEIDKMWCKVDRLQERTVELQMQSRILSERIEAMSTCMHESNGRTAKSLDEIQQEVRNLSDSLIKIQAMKTAIAEISRGIHLSIMFSLPFSLAYQGLQ